MRPEYDDAMTGLRIDIGCGRKKKEGTVRVESAPGPGVELGL